MKKKILLILMALIFLNIFIVKEINVTYAKEDDVIWLNENFRFVEVFLKVWHT